MTTSLRTSNTVSGAATEAKSIHVKVIKVPDVQIVYHTYTYRVPEEDYDSISTKSGSDLENAVKELTPSVSSTTRSIPLAESSYQASRDTTATGMGSVIHVTPLLAGKEAPLKATPQSPPKTGHSFKHLVNASVSLKMSAKAH